MTNARVTLNGVPLAANQPIVWQLTTGTQPYATTLQVHSSDWPKLEPSLGATSVLKIEDARGESLTIENVTILHVVATDVPERVTFVVSDVRWKWSRTLIVRDYNVTRKTGSRDFAGNPKPIETQQVIDLYDYKPYSLNNGRRWTARDAIEDVLRQVVDDEFLIETFPINDEGEEGQATLNNVLLRDAGDVAIQRLLSYIPGADIYVHPDGRVRVIDAASLGDAESYANTLPPLMVDGDVVQKIERKAIRPSKVIVYYPREVEVLLEYEDDYSGQTSANPVRNAPYLENVAQTVDPSTTVYGYDPEGNGNVIMDEVPPGTWVNFKDLLYAWDQIRPASSEPWTFDTLRKFWVEGSLDGLLGAGGENIDETPLVALRVQQIKKHFRQTFRLSRRYMERIRDIRAVRVGVLNPVTGQRAPATVWGQAAVIPSMRGRMAIQSRQNSADGKLLRNIDSLAPSRNGAPIATTEPGPATVEFLDREVGVFRINWIASPYGTDESWVPCHVTNGSTDTSSGQPFGVARNLGTQDENPIVFGAQVEELTNGLFLKATMECKVLLTIVPAAPNNKRQFHPIEVEADQISEVFRDAFGLEDGDGPEIELFVAPGEATARFAWSDDAAARQTVEQLLGLNSDDPNQAGIPIEDLEQNGLAGYTLVNEERELRGHSLAIAAEAIVDYADSVQGQAATILTDNVRIAGNVSSVAIRVDAAPDARVSMRHTMPGRQRPLTRFALLPDSSRQMLLGTLPFDKD